MVKNKKSATKKYIITKQSLPVIILSSITGILVLAAIIGGIVIKDLWAQQSRDNDKITTLILQALDNLSSDAPVDAKTGKVYIPQAHLVLPAQQDTYGADIEYRYAQGGKDYPEELSIMNAYGFWSARTKMISAQNMEDTFKAVPELQACATGYRLSFKPIVDSSTPLRFAKTLSNGKILYVYLDEKCVQTNEEFENYLKLIDSY